MRTGIYVSDFDPVCSGQIAFCIDAIRSKTCDRVLLVLLPASSCSAYSVSDQDRLRMLIAACEGNKDLEPVLYPRPDARSMTERQLLQYLKTRYPKERLMLLSQTDSVSVLPGDVLPLLSEDADFLLSPSVREYCSVLGLYGASSRIQNAVQRMDILFHALKPHRFSHSLSVALTAKTMAARYGINPDKAEEAGLFHDCAKCMPLSKMQKVAYKHSLTEDPAFLSSAALLHSIVGAQVAYDTYGITDPEILDAIAFHNTGLPGMSRLAMCVCLADFIEPNRPPFPMLDEIRRLADVSLEQALLLSLECTIRHVRSKGKTLHSRTLDTVTWLKSLPCSDSAAP